MGVFALYGRAMKKQVANNTFNTPSSEHGRASSKHLGELVLHTCSEDFELKAVILRASFVQGERQRERSVLMEFVESAT